VTGLSLPVLVAQPWADYALLDSGHGGKFERYGPIRVIRPEPQALWRPRLENWDAHAVFVGDADEDAEAATKKNTAMAGRWRFDKPVPDAWPLAWGGVKFWASCTPFRHLAFFPDMSVHWAWVQQRLKNGDAVLNMFGYTGVASLVAAQAGATVTHVDASKKAINAAVENQKLSGLADKPIRWIVDDAQKFLAREGRRGKRYQLVLLDPPKFGRGPEGERWDLFAQLPQLLAHAREVIDPDRGALILTVYAIRASALAIGQAVADVFGATGTLEVGEMAIAEEQFNRLLPTAIYVRWSAR
jgi:23S rRNA (cytosine1962-C5)-methyltransferase